MEDVKVAPSVTLEEVEALIKSERYVLLPNGRTTICQLTLVDNGDSGFTVEGMSACVSAANYNQAQGEDIARKNAINQIWQLLGFELARKLEQNRMLEGEDYRDRLRREYASLHLKIARLDAWMKTPDYESLDPSERDDQKEQLVMMKGYSEVLDRRMVRLMNLTHVSTNALTNPTLSTEPA